MPIDGLPGGDFSGCVQTMRGKMDSPEGFCAWKEHELTGKWPTEEALKITGVTEAVDLHETAPASLTVREAQLPNVVFMDGTLIEEGLSKNDHRYTLESLESAAAVFAGKPIRVNHPGRSEDSNRPEGDVWTQVGKLPDANSFEIVQRPNGPAGLHDCIFKGALLSASAPDIWISDRIRAGIIGDMSINAGGEGVREADGSFTVMRFTAATSHDLVTTAAAGGRAALQEAQTGVEKNMTAEELEKLIEAQVQKALGGVNLVDRVLEAQGLPREFKELLEAEAARLKAAEELLPAPPVQEQGEQPAPDFLGDLPDAQKQQWGDAFTACMAVENADEMACAHGSWLALVKTLLPAPAEEGAEEEQPVEEALQVYARKLKAALAKSPGVGQVQGMGSGGASQPPAAPEKPYTERVKEAFAAIPGFTEKMAATAAGGR